MKTSVAIIRRALLSVVLAAIAGPVFAQCDPAAATPGTVGCQTTVSGNVVSTDYLLGWRPSAPKGLSVKVPPARILEAGLPGAFGTLIAGSGGAAPWTISSGQISMATGQTGNIFVSSGQMLRIRTSSTNEGIARFTGGTTPTFDTDETPGARTRLGRTWVKAETMTFTGAFSNADAPFAVSFNASGSPAGIVGWYPYSRISIASDTTSLGGSGVGVGLYMTHNVGGVATTGDRIAAVFELIQTDQSGASGIGDSPIYTGLTALTEARATEGGVPTPGLGAGSVFGLNTYSRLRAAASGFRELNGHEIDISAETGSSYRLSFGLAIVLESIHREQASNFSSAIVFAGQQGAVPTWDNYISGSTPAGIWSLASTGQVLSMNLGNNWWDTPQTALNGLNILEATFSRYAMLTRGAAIDGNGKLRVATGYLGSTATGVSLDASGLVGLAEAATISGGAIVSGGTSGFAARDILRDQWGGTYQVDTVTAGVITQLTVYRRSYAPAGTSATVTLTKDKFSVGVGTVQVTQTWTALSELQVQPSGGATLVGGTAASPRIQADGGAQSLFVPIQADYTSGSGVTQGNHFRVQSLGSPYEHWNVLITSSSNSVAGTPRLVPLYVQGSNFSSGGTAANRWIWGAVIEARDDSGVSSATGAGLQSIEVNVAANGADDRAGYGRLGIVIIASKADAGGTDMTASYALALNTGTGSKWHRGIEAGGTYTQSVLDTRSATVESGGYAIWLKTDHVIAMDTSAATKLTSNGVTVTVTGHIGTDGTAPAVSSCGTTPSAVTGNDTAGRLTTGTAAPTACTLTFATAFASNPKCLANASVGGVPQAVAPTAISTTAVTFTFAAAMTSGTVDYHCIQ